MARHRLHRRRLTPLAGAVLAGMLGSGAMMLGASYATFNSSTDNSGNTVSAGTVVRGDDDERHRSGRVTPGDGGRLAQDGLEQPRRRPSQTLPDQSADAPPAYHPSGHLRARLLRSKPTPTPLCPAREQLQPPLSHLPES